MTMPITESRMYHYGFSNKENKDFFDKHINKIQYINILRHNQYYPGVSQINRERISDIKDKGFPQFIDFSKKQVNDWYLIFSGVESSAVRLDISIPHIFIYPHRNFNNTIAIKENYTLLVSRDVEYGSEDLRMIRRVFFQSIVLIPVYKLRDSRIGSIKRFLYMDLQLAILRFDVRNIHYEYIEEWEDDYNYSREWVDNNGGVKNE